MNVLAMHVPITVKISKAASNACVTTVTDWLKTSLHVWRMVSSRFPHSLLTALECYPKLLCTDNVVFSFATAVSNDFHFYCYCNHNLTFIKLASLPE